MFCLYRLSELFEALGTSSKANLTFSDVSVWMRNFWKMLENASVDGEHFIMETPFSCISGFMKM